MSLRSPFVFSLAVAFALALGARAWAQAEVADSISVTGTVTAIDLAKRTVDLKDEAGKTATIVVPSNVQNLEKLKVGDTVNMTYAAAFAAEIMKPGQEPAPVSASSSRQGGGEVVRADQVSAVLKVESVDLANNTVTLTGPKGNTRTVKVRRPDIQERIKTLKPGDQVQVTYTEAMAIKVEPKEK